MTIKNSNFTNNEARWGGGAVNMYAGNVDTFFNCIFERNTATSHGGALKVYGGSLSGIYNCTFINNNGSDGGALYCIPKPAVFNNFTFIII